MSLPIAAPTTTITFGLGYDLLGNVADLSGLTVKADRDLVWEATGETVYASVGVTAPTITDGNRVSMDVYDCDAAGWLDHNGSAVTNWYYTLSGPVKIGRSTVTVKKVFQVVSGQATIDLDLIPDNAAVIPSVTVTNDTAAAQSAAAAAQSAEDAASSLASFTATEAAAVASSVQPGNAVDTALGELVGTAGSATAAQLKAAIAGQAGVPRSLDGTDSLPEPTGEGLEFIIGADGLDDIRFNGVSL